MKQSRQVIILSVILLSGLILRVLAADSYWKWYDTTFPRSWEVSKLVLSHDGQQYIHQARPDTWRSAHPYYREWEKKPFYRPPLASCYFAALFRASSFDRLTVSTVQSLLALGAYFLVYLLAARLLGPRTAVITLLVLVLHPVLIFYDISFEDSPLALFLTALTLSLVVRQRGRQRWRWLLPGVVMGLSLLVRPNLVIVFLILAVYLWFVEPMRRVERVLIFALPVLMLLSWPIWHNYRTSGRFTFVTDTAGENLFWGNNAHPHYRITTQGFWRIPLVDYANPARLLFDTIRTETGETSLDRALRAAVVRYVREDPVGAGYELLRKAVRHVSNYEIPRNRNFSWLRTSSAPFRLPLIPYSILAACALIGWMATVPRTREMFVLLAPWIGAIVVEVIFFNASRYRALGLPFIVPFAVVGATTLFSAVGRRKWKCALASALLLILFFLAGRQCVPAGEKQSYLSASYYKAAMLEAYGGPDGEFRLISKDRFRKNLVRSLEYDSFNHDAFSMYVKYLIVSGRPREAVDRIRNQRKRCRESDFLCFEVCRSLDDLVKALGDGETESGNEGE